MAGPTDGRRSSARPYPQRMFRKRADRIRGISGSLDSSTALVVDAVTGAGPGVVRVLAEAGAAVLAGATDPAMLDVQLSRLNTMPIPVTPLAGGPATDESVDQLLSELPEKVDMLVVNPALDEGVTPLQPILTLARLVAAKMQDRGSTGSIVFVSSVERAGLAGSAAAFLRSEMEQMAVDFAPNGIRVNAVAAGPVGAGRRSNVLSSRATPLGHVTLHPVEVGKSVWFLLNENLSGGMTGTTLRIDRGASLLRPDW